MQVTRDMQRSINHIASRPTQKPTPSVWSILSTYPWVMNEELIPCLRQPSIMDLPTPTVQYERDSS
jgi:hypothetical protein